MFQQHISLKGFDKRVQPRARISIFRGDVKDRCAVAVTLLVNNFDLPTVIADLIDRQINDNYNYIFPRRSNISLHDFNLIDTKMSCRVISSVGQRFALAHIEALLSSL
jgi:hypothetical protein